MLKSQISFDLAERKVPVGKKPKVGEDNRPRVLVNVLVVKGQDMAKPASLRSTIADYARIAERSKGFGAVALATQNLEMARALEAEGAKYFEEKLAKGKVQAEYRHLSIPEGRSKGTYEASADAFVTTLNLQSVA